LVLAGYALPREQNYVKHITKSIPGVKKFMKLRDFPDSFPFPPLLPGYNIK
jgi:hypothetical protein